MTSPAVTESGVAADGTAAVSAGMAEELARLGEFDARLCMNCGICTATCPLGIDVLPRQVMRHAELGLAGRVADEEEAVFSCLLCKACEENCPAGVHITRNIRLLRRWLLEGGH
jgi:heterodisulfide reductase subunit C